MQQVKTRKSHKTNIVKEKNYCLNQYGKKGVAEYAYIRRYVDGPPKY